MKAATCDRSLNLWKKRRIISVLLKIDEERAVEEEMWEVKRWRDG